MSADLASGLKNELERLEPRPPHWEAIASRMRRQRRTRAIVGVLLALATPTAVGGGAVAAGYPYKVTLFHMAPIQTGAKCRGELGHLYGSVAEAQAKMSLPIKEARGYQLLEFDVAGPKRCDGARDQPVRRDDLVGSRTVYLYYAVGEPGHQARALVIEMPPLPSAGILVPDTRQGRRVGRYFWALDPRWPAGGASTLTPDGLWLQVELQGGSVPEVQADAFLSALGG